MGSILSLSLSPSLSLSLSPSLSLSLPPFPNGPAGRNPSPAPARACARADVFNQLTLSQLCVN